MSTVQRYLTFLLALEVSAAVPTPWRVDGCTDLWALVEFSFHFLFLSWCGDGFYIYFLFFVWILRILLARGIKSYIHIWICSPARACVSYEKCISAASEAANATDEFPWMPLTWLGVLGRVVRIDRVDRAGLDGCIDMCIYIYIMLLNQCANICAFCPFSRSRTEGLAKKQKHTHTATILIIVQHILCHPAIGGKGKVKVTAVLLL